MLASGPSGGSVRLRWLLHAAALSAPPRAASLRGFVAVACRGLDDGATLEDLRARLDPARAAPVSDDRAALARLVFEDVASLVGDAPPFVAQWIDPLQAIESSLAILRDALGALGIDLDMPRVHLSEGLPPPYDAPFLDAISVDATDAAQLGLAAGIHVDRRRLAPGLTECVLGHVLVHVALGQRSPEHLGRGLEEGIAEIVGALHAAGHVIGEEAAERSFALRLFTGSASPHREAFLNEVNRAALVHRRHGLAGLAQLVREGRPAVKRAESLLAGGRFEDLAMPRTEPVGTLQATLDRVTQSSGRPLVVSPLAFLLACEIAAGRSVREAAEALAMPRDLALAAARELMTGPFVLVLADDGRVLVHDLDVVLPSRSLRYAVARELRP